MSLVVTAKAGLSTKWQMLPHDLPGSPFKVAKSQMTRSFHDHLAVAQGSPTEGSKIGWHPA